MVENKYWYRGKFKKIVLTEYGKQYLIKHFPNTKNALYYDELGEFHVERRLGCLCCPLQSHHKRIEDFKRYPKMVKLYCDNGKKWLQRHPNINTKGMDIYEKIHAGAHL